MNKWLNTHRNHLIVVGVTMLMCYISMGMYMQGYLGGDFNKHFTPSREFGIPSDLRSHGIEELLKRRGEGGWDGQSYYYVANDILGLKEGPAHCADAPAYRYQRVGVPLLAFILSHLFLQNWVSPFVYYLTSLSLVLGAVWMAGNYFMKRGMAARWILLWSLGMGVQITMMQGLPDAGADALLIIALVCLAEKRHVLFCIAAIFAGLAREAYVLVPVMVGSCILISRLRELKQDGVSLALSSEKWKSVVFTLIPFVLPAAAVLGWQAYIRCIFEVSPSTTAEHIGILGKPFAGIVKYCFAGFNGKHPLFYGKYMGTYEAIGLLIFSALLLFSVGFSVCIIVRRFWRKSITEESFRIAGVSVAMIMMGVMYMCFGDLVIMHYSGYFKAANIFLFLLPFIYVWNEPVRSAVCQRFLGLFLLLVTAYFGFAWYERVHPTINFRLLQLTYPDDVEFAKTPPPALKTFDIETKLIAAEEECADTGLPGFPVIKSRILHVVLTNRTTQAFYPYDGLGCTNMSYHWIDRQSGAVVKDGIRTSLARALLPNESVEIKVLIEFPEKKGRYILRLSPVQEGVAWFYTRNPNSKLDLEYTIL